MLQTSVPVLAWSADRSLRNVLAELQEFGFVWKGALMDFESMDYRVGLTNTGAPSDGLGDRLLDEFGYSGAESSALVEPVANDAPAAAV